MGSSILAYWYGALRMRTLQKVNGRPLVYPEGAIRRSIKAIKSGSPGNENVWACGMVDVPPTPADPGEPVLMFGQRGFFSTGLIGVARISKVPLVMVECGLELDNGRRKLMVSGPFDPASPGLLQKIATHWQARIEDCSWGFFLWAAVPAWFIEWPRGSQRLTSK